MLKLQITLYSENATNSKYKTLINSLINNAPLLLFLSNCPLIS